MRFFAVSLFLFLLASCSALLPTVKSSFTPADPIHLREKLPKRSDGIANTFAIIIGGNTELRHRGNISLAYQALVENGQERANTFILDPEGDVPWYPWTAETSLESIRLLFSRLAAVADSDDAVIIYITGHGQAKNIDFVNKEGSHEKMRTYGLKLNQGEYMSRLEFTELVNSLHVKKGLLVVDTCYWGPLPDINCRWVQMTATNTGDESSDTTFGRVFWNRIRQSFEPDAAFNAAVMASNPEDHPGLRICRDDTP